MKFWSIYQHQYSILSAVARRVLAIPATSASTERLFSASGRVCTFDRSRLKPATVDMLSTPHKWGKSDKDEDRRSALRRAGNDRFCKLKVNDLSALEVVQGTQE